MMANSISLCRANARIEASRKPLDVDGHDKHGTDKVIYVGTSSDVTLQGKSDIHYSGSIPAS